MKLLHTSDWHIGRTFHGRSTVDALREVLDDLVAKTRENAVDVVAIAGDVFDSAMPAAEHYALLTETLVALRETGAEVVVTSGNHDSAARLGFQSSFLGRSGVHVITGPEQYAEPIVIADEHGPVNIYGIAYLEPALFRHRHPDVKLKRHDEVIEFVMDNIRKDIAERGGRSVVLSHCFAAGVAASTVERDITAGGLDYVSLDRFAGSDYVALGHIHGRHVLADNVRYSGSPLHYSFDEAGKPRGAWLVELDAHGFAGATWLDLLVPRRLAVITGELAQVLADPSLAEHCNDWVLATLTDTVRPIDAMAKLKKRFPRCAAVVHRPAIVAEPAQQRYTARIAAKTDPEIVAAFLAHVRNGVGPNDAEIAVVNEALAELSAEAAR